MGASRSGRAQTVDEAARDGMLVKLRQDLVASRGSSSFLPWTGEPLNIHSRGRFPRDMVTSSRDPDMLAGLSFLVIVKVFRK